MGEISDLKSHISYARTPLFFFEIPPCARKVIFVTEFVFFCKNSPFCEVEKIFLKRFCGGI